MYSVKETVEKNIKGMFFGNRLILPFKANFLKVILDDEIITDFSPRGGRVHIIENENFTDFYFAGISDMHDKLSKYEAIKIILSEKATDIFDLKNHLKISIYLKDPHTLIIENTDKDIPFIE